MVKNFSPTHSRIENDKVVDKLVSAFSKSRDNRKFLEYLLGKKSSLLKEISHGSELLPSPSFFQEVINLDLCNSANKNCSIASNLADEYYKDVFINGIKNQDNFKLFCDEFEKKSQPLGKKLLNYVLLMRLHYLAKEYKEQNKFLMSNLNKIAIYVTKKFSDDPEKAELLYSGVSISAILTIAAGSFFLAGGLTSIFASIVSSLSTAIAGIIVSITLHRFNSFEHTDISGKNLLALKYKSLFTQELATATKKKKFEGGFKLSDTYPSSGSGEYHEEKLLEIA